VHHNHYVSVMVVFVLAQLLHIFMRAMGVRHSKLTGITSYKQYFDEYGWGILSNFIVAFGLLLFWIMNPQILTNAASRSQWVINHVGPINLPLNPVTAAIFGYTIDSIIGKLAWILPIVFPWLRPWLGREVPPAPPLRTEAGDQLLDLASRVTGLPK
jgi:hypothetical protein